MQGCRVVGAVNVFQDITGRKQAERALIVLRERQDAELADLKRLQEMSLRLSTGPELGPILEETLKAAAAVEGADMGLLSLCNAERDYLEVGASLGFDGASLDLIGRVPPGGGACGTCFLERRCVVVEDTETDPSSGRTARRRVGPASGRSTARP